MVIWSSLVHSVWRSMPEFPSQKYQPQTLLSIVSLSSVFCSCVSTDCNFLIYKWFLCSYIHLIWKNKLFGEDRIYGETHGSLKKLYINLVLHVYAGLMSTYHAKNEYCLLSDMCQGYQVFVSIISQLEDWHNKMTRWKWHHHIITHKHVFST